MVVVRVHASLKGRHPVPSTWKVWSSESFCGAVDSKSVKIGPLIDVSRMFGAAVGAVGYLRRVGPNTLNGLALCHGIRGPQRFCAIELVSSQCGECFAGCVFDE